MQNWTSVVILVAILAGAQHCFAEDIEWTCDFTDVQYRFIVKEEQLRHWPDWDEKTDNPPVSPRAALTMAKLEFAKLYVPEDHASWVVDRPELKLCQFYGERWVWFVTYAAWPKGLILDNVPPRIDFVVTMDGKLVPVEKTDTRSDYTDYIEKHSLQYSGRETPTEGLQARFDDLPWSFCQGTETFDGKKCRDAVLCWTVTKEMLNKAPGWQKSADFPPLSARSAIAAARAGVDKFTGPLENCDWRWSDPIASLQELAENRWVWIVEYGVRTSHGGGGGVFPTFRVVVFMNGEVAPMAEKR